MTRDDTRKPDPVYRYVGNRLRQLRRDRGLKQAAVAEVIGVSPQQYQKYEDAQSKCSLTNLYKLADFFRVDLAAILPVEGTVYEAGDAAPPRHVAEAAGNAPAPPVDAASVDADLLARLVSAFMAIEGPATRRQLVALVETLAREQGGD